MDSNRCSNCGEKGRADSQEVIHGFSRDRANLIPILHALQKTMGYLTADAIEEVAAWLSVPISDVYGTATFYTLFATKPTGKYRILLCDTPACHLEGSTLVRKAIEKHIGVSPGDTTPDQMFSFALVDCLGLCDMAPAMMIDEDVYGNLTPEMVPAILDKYRKES